jgi:prenyl protein peptidase
MSFHPLSTPTKTFSWNPFVLSRRLPLPPASFSSFRMAPPILLSPTSTLLISSAFTSSYVASVYLLPHTRIKLSPPQPSVPPVDLAAGAAPSAAAAPPPPPDRPRDRNHPAVIRARLCAVSLSSLTSALSIPYIIRYFSISPSPVSLPPLHRLLGLGLHATLNQLGALIALPLGLTASLFAGSLYITWLCEGMPGQRRWSWREAKAEYGGWQGVRNLVVVSPVSLVTRRSEADDVRV